MLIGAFTPLGPVLGLAVGAVLGFATAMDKARKIENMGATAYAFGEGKGAIDLQDFAKDMAKSMDFQKLSEDVSKGMDLTKLSAKDLSIKLRMAYGASSELGASMHKLGKNDLRVLTQQLTIMALDTARAQAEIAAMNKLFAKQKTQMEAVNAAIAANEKALENWMSTLTALNKIQSSVNAAREKNNRSLATAGSQNARKLHEPFMTGEAKAQSTMEMSNIQVNNKFLDKITKIQDKTRTGMVDAVGKMGGDKLNDKTLLKIQKANLEAVKNGWSNTRLMQELGNITQAGLGKLSGLPEFQAQMNGLLATQNGDLKIANMDAKTQIALNKMQLELQKKVLQQQKDVKTLGGLNTFMDPEGAGKQKAEGFEKALKAFEVGSVRDDKLQKGRGAIGLLRSAMDAGVDIHQPGGEAFKKQAIEGNAAFIKNTFLDRAKRLEQEANVLQGQGKGAEAGQLREQARGYRQQAGRATEISENQVFAEFKKAQMPQNVADIKAADQAILGIQQVAFARREEDMTNALRASGIQNATQQVENAILAQTRLLAQQEALKEKQEAERKKKVAEERKKTAEGKTEQNLRHLRVQAFDASLGGTSGVGNKRARKTLGGLHSSGNVDKGMKVLLKNVIAGSEGKIKNLEDMRAASEWDIAKAYAAGQKITGEGKSMDTYEQQDAFTEAIRWKGGGIFENMMASQNTATKAYIEQLNQMMDAFSVVNEVDKELASLAANLATANAAYVAATNSLTAADATITAQQEVSALEGQQTNLQGEKTQKMREADAKVKAAKDRVDAAAVGGTTREKREAGKELADAEAERTAIEARYNAGLLAAANALAVAQAALAAAEAAKAAAAAPAGGGPQGTLPTAGPAPAGAAGGVPQIVPKIVSPELDPITGLPIDGPGVPKPQPPSQPSGGPLGAPAGAPAGGEQQFDPITGEPVGAGGPIPGSIPGSRPGPIPGGPPEVETMDKVTDSENPMTALATNVGSLIERLDDGIYASHSINFETPLPLVVTVQGEVSKLITPEDIAKIENAVIAKLSKNRPQNNGGNGASNQPMGAPNL